MRNVELAESILSLAATPEHASAMAGDFLEEYGANACRFWFQVARTAASQAWRQAAAGPRAMAGIAIRGAAAEQGLLLAACLVYLLALSIVTSILWVNFHAHVPDRAVFGLAWFLSNLLVPFSVGCWMARRYPGREGAAILMLAGMHAAINLCAGLILAEIARHGGTAHIDVIFILPFIYWDSAVSTLRAAVFFATLYPLLLLTGAAFSRAHSRRSAAL